MANRGKPTGEAPEETDYRPVNWRRVFLTPKYIPWHIIGIGVLIFTIYITIKHDEVVEKLRPFSEGLHDLPAGWLIPIAILFVISFPPLFGHEIVALLCGVVWGLWLGFAIVAAGTFLGEIGTWYAFLYLLRRKAAKLERTNLNYGALARLTRDGGFWIVLVIRLSAIPSHFSTAVFATCNVKFLYFFIATFLSLPKQIFLVYLGVLLVQKKESNVGKNVMFGAVFVVTVVLGVWIWMKMAKVKKVLLEEQAGRREKALMEEMEEADRKAAERRVEIHHHKRTYMENKEKQEKQEIIQKKTSRKKGYLQNSRNTRSSTHPPPRRQNIRRQRNLILWNPPRTRLDLFHLSLSLHPPSFSTHHPIPLTTILPPRRPRRRPRLTPILLPIVITPRRRRPHHLHNLIRAPLRLRKPRPPLHTPIRNPHPIDLRRGEMLHPSGIQRIGSHRGGNAEVVFWTGDSGRVGALAGERRRERWAAERDVCGGEFAEEGAGAGPLPETAGGRG
ncbi:hypothetical protein GRF29_185g94206 [Pseudopithomyces chartarum]|uniref:Golgi apparatus membrane protein TVP38 n=1 Tax=Pseudopithomyces chartarum TaxID=1892770 RepID=A0AAN6LP40_9PLEO|nr:hypothetical protein GRF29_185g94206 [Pseudopithomyces chartarum]